MANIVEERSDTAILRGKIIKKGDKLIAPETVIFDVGNGPFVTQYLRNTVWTVDYFVQRQGKTVVYLKEVGCGFLDWFFDFEALQEERAFLQEKIARYEKEIAEMDDDD